MTAIVSAECARCAGHGWYMVTMATRRDYPIRDNHGDIDTQECEVCRGTGVGVATGEADPVDAQ